MLWGPETYLQLCIFSLIPLMHGLYLSSFLISPGLGQLEFFVSNALKTIAGSSFYWLVNLSKLYRLCSVRKFHQTSIIITILQ